MVVKKRRLGKGTYLENRLLTSQAWLDLNAIGKFMFGIFRLKCQISKVKSSRRHEITIDNNGEITFTYEEAKKIYGISTYKFRKGLDELISMGFLDVTETGAGVHKVTTKFAISDRWMIYEQPHFQQAQRPKPVRANPGFKKGNDMWKKRKDKKMSSVESSHGAVLEYSHGETDSRTITVLDYSHGLNFKNVPKWRNGQWLKAKIA